MAKEERKRPRSCILIHKTCISRQRIRFLQIIFALTMILLPCASAFSRSLVVQIKSSQRTCNSRLLSSSTATTNDAVALKHTDFSSSTTTTTTTTPAVFLHGLLGNKRNFASIARSLSQQLEKPRRIVGLDLRNHGTLRAKLWLMQNNESYLGD